MLWADSSNSLPNNYYSTLAHNSRLKRKYTETINKDLDKVYIISVKTHAPQLRSSAPPLNGIYPTIMFLNQQARPDLSGFKWRVKIHGQSLNHSLLVGPDLLQNLAHMLMRSSQHQFAVSADIEVMFLPVGVPPCDKPSLRFFCGAKMPHRMWKFPVYPACFRYSVLPDMRELLTSANS